MYFNLPTRLYVGENVVVNNKDEFASLGRRCLIVTGKSSAKKSGALDDVIAALTAHGIEWKIFDEVGQNPYLSVCYRGGLVAADFGAEFVIGIGGGSPLDAAKAIAVFGAHPYMSPSDIFGIPQENALPIVLVGTTAGTASEITRFSILTDDKTGEKCGWGAQYSYATVSFGDYRYTESLPFGFTVTTALDSFSHAVEGYFSKKADELSDIMSIETLKLLLPVLEEMSVRNGTVSRQQREKLYTASIYAGFPLNRCGTIFCHRMGYYMTETRQMSHGNACALFQPELLAHAQKHAQEKCDRLYKALGRSNDQVLDTLRLLTVTDFEPLRDDEIEVLLNKWRTAENMQYVLGGMTAQEQRGIAERVMQKKR